MKNTSILVALLVGAVVAFGLSKLSSGTSKSDDAGASKSAGDVVGGWVDWAIGKYASGKGKKS